MSIPMHIQTVQVEKILKLSPAWVKLFEFVQQHPHVAFEQLKFKNADPDFGTQDLKITESIRF